MKWNTVQLMIYGEDLNGITVRSKSPFLTIKKIHTTKNPSYAFIDIEIVKGTPAGNYALTVSRGSSSAVINYPILRRESSIGKHLGFTQSDVLYLITPDRFVNGDTTNDSIPGMLDGFHPDKLIGRHGGDLQGILSRLDYIKDLGMTGIWINPVIENNTEISYHGYAATDFYRVDSRFGSNELYKHLVDEAHKRGLKIILDHVSNHISIHHPWIKNLPSPDWLNGTVEQHDRTHHFKSTMHDIHSDSTLRNNVTDGWFTDYMPDLNQRNPFLATYLIQNTLWWIEYSGLDGIREDTYPYADRQFLARWSKAIKKEYPSFNIVGEVWINDPAFLAPYQSGTGLAGKFETHLPSVTDFGLFEAFMNVFGDEKANIRAIHEMLAKDFLYANPDNLVTFLDNHDVARIMYVCRGNIQRAKLALTLLLTLRGIPQIYYGTELGMVGGTDHGEIRAEFPGGFPWHTRNAFAKEGRTAVENEMFDFLQKLIALRTAHPALSRGKLTQIPSWKNVLMYFRKDANETILVIANNGEKAEEVEVQSFLDVLKNAIALEDLSTGKEISLAHTSRLTLEGNTASLFKVLLRK
jgi:glycosidase